MKRLEEKRKRAFALDVERREFVERESKKEHRERKLNMECPQKYHQERETEKNKLIFRKGNKRYHLDHHSVR